MILALTLTLRRKGKKNEDDKKFVAQLDGLARCFKGLNT
jgi:hypothetical protein